LQGALKMRLNRTLRRLESLINFLDFLLVSNASDDIANKT
jgi:hypothetical protein